MMPPPGYPLKLGFLPESLSLELLDVDDEVSTVLKLSVPKYCCNDETTHNPLLMKMKAFKLELGGNTSPAAYEVRPAEGVVIEGETCEVILTCKAGHRPSAKDVFTLLSCKVNSREPPPNHDSRWSKGEQTTITVAIKLESADERKRRLAAADEKMRSSAKDTQQADLTASAKAKPRARRKSVKRAPTAEALQEVRKTEAATPECTLSQEGDVYHFMKKAEVSKQINVQSVIVSL